MQRFLLLQLGTVARALENVKQTTRLGAILCLSILGPSSPVLICKMLNRMLRAHSLRQQNRWGSI
eukprot:551109-Amphidinium_carterae.1